ncbi:MAG: hypothetical protein KGZ81_03445 [Flavobacteriales bacterium]|nr:hypothetical protein [Flavobacteriales bacterium]
MKPYKTPILLFLIGILITLVGVALKIMHVDGANLVLILGMLTEALAIISLIWVILKKK